MSSASFVETDFLQALGGWAAGQRVAGAARARSRQRSLSASAAASATLIGILVDLAEDGSEAVVDLGRTGPASSRLSGRVVGVGRDFFVLEGPTGRPVVVRTATVTAVTSGASRPGPGPGGDRKAPLSLSFSGVADGLAAEELPVAVATASGLVEGDLVAVGVDVLTVRPRGRGRRRIHVPLDAVAWLEPR